MELKGAGAGCAEPVLLPSPSHRCCPHAEAAGVGSCAVAEGPPPGSAAAGPQWSSWPCPASCFPPAGTQAVGAQARPAPYLPHPPRRARGLAFMKTGSLGLQSGRSHTPGTQDPWVCGVGWVKAAQHHPSLWSGSWGDQSHHIIGPERRRACWEQISSLPLEHPPSPVPPGQGSGQD